MNFFKRKPFYRDCLIGTGGLTKQLLSDFEGNLSLDNVCFFNDLEKIDSFYHRPVFHTVTEVVENCGNVLICVSNPLYREKLTHKFMRHGAVTILRSVPRRYTHYFEGNNISFSDSPIEMGAQIKWGTVINRKCAIHHDSRIGRYVTLSPNVIVLGRAQIGDYTFVGAGSIIRDGVKIGKHCVIGMGSIVTKDVPDNVVAYGNPCKIIKENNDTHILSTNISQ